MVIPGNRGPCCSANRSFSNHKRCPGVSFMQVGQAVLVDEEIALHLNPHIDQLVVAFRDGFDQSAAAMSFDRSRGQESGRHPHGPELHFRLHQLSGHSCEIDTESL